MHGGRKERGKSGRRESRIREGGWKESIMIWKDGWMGNSIDFMCIIIMHYVQIFLAVTQRLKC